MNPDRHICSDNCDHTQRREEPHSQCGAAGDEHRRYVADIIGTVMKDAERWTPSRTYVKFTRAEVMEIEHEFARLAAQPAAPSRLIDPANPADGHWHKLYDDGGFMCPDALTCPQISAPSDAEADERAFEEAWERQGYQLPNMRRDLALKDYKAGWTDALAYARRGK